MKDPTRGITCPDMRRVVREALAHGWEWHGFTGTTHAQIRWTDGTTLGFGTTPSLASWKSLASKIERASGVKVWRKGNHGRSRKAIRPSGFSINGTHAGRHTEDIEALRAKHSELREEWELLVTAPTRANARRAAELLPAIKSTEAALVALYQPVEPIVK